MLKVFKIINKLFKRNTEMDCIIEPIGDDYPITGNPIVYKIPVGGLSKGAAEQKISELMKEYNEEIIWDDTMGEVTINGSTHLPFSKDMWFPTIPTKKQYNI